LPGAETRWYYLEIQDASLGTASVFGRGIYFKHGNRIPITYGLPGS